MSPILLAKDDRGRRAVTMQEKGVGSSPRKVIAVVTDAFAPFHREVLNCIRPHFDAAGFGTLGVAGRDVRSDRLLEAAAERGGLYRGAFGTELEVQGAVIVCGATHPSMSPEAVHDYVSSLTDGPVVSLGIVLPGLPSVAIAWPHGIQALMQHVLGLKGVRRLAFVQGFPGDPHSEMREAGFRQAMNEAGAPVDERLIVRGNFSIADARRAVAGLLATGLSFDGVIAANDDMAVGAMAAINAHGLSVPDDVVVAGFDDAVSSITSAPTLTTVRLDNRRLTAASAQIVIDAIESGVAPAPDLEIDLACPLIIRASTGVNRSLTGTALVAERFTEHWEHDLAPADVDLDVLANEAVAALHDGGTSFLEHFEQLCAEAASSGNLSGAIWLRHVWRSLQLIVSELDDDAGTSNRGVVLGQLATLDRIIRRIEVRHETERSAHRQLQERLIMRLASCSDAPSLWEALRSGLRSIGMVNAWVVTPVAESQRTEQTASMELVFSLAEDELARFDRFEARRILPSALTRHLERDTHVLVPLRAGDSDIGYMVIEPRGEYLLELESIASGVAQVLRHVGQVADLEAQTLRFQLANEALDRLARQDTLTGLANRKHFVTKLEEHVANVRSEESLAMVFLDLDGFKLINDTLGHGAGDQLLRIIADRLADVIGPGDTLARLGGDEFTMIVHDPENRNRIVEVAHQTLEVAAEAALVAGQEVGVTASVGVARFPADGETAEELMRNADTAMYAAKNGGRNRFEIFCDLDEQPTVQISHRVTTPAATS